MVRTLDIVMIAVMIGGRGASPTRSSTRPSRPAARVETLETRIRLEREAIDLLKADWSLLTSPDRLQKLVERHQEELGLEPLSPRQIVTIDEMPAEAARARRLSTASNCARRRPPARAMTPSTDRSPRSAADRSRRSMTCPKAARTRNHGRSANERHRRRWTRAAEPSCQAAALAGRRLAVSQARSRIMMAMVVVSCVYLLIIAAGSSISACWSPTRTAAQIKADATISARRRHRRPQWRDAGDRHQDRLALRRAAHASSMPTRRSSSLSTRAARPRRRDGPTHKLQDGRLRLAEAAS